MNKAVINATINAIKENAGGRCTGFVIGNTSDKFTKGSFYETPVRESSEIIYGGVVVRDVATAKKIATLVDGKVDYIFVDDEKKIRDIYYGPNDIGNIEQEVRRLINKSTLLTYKGNDIAVDAIDGLVSNIKLDVGGCRVAIIGMGNLGSKVALRMVERGAYVYAYRRNQKKLLTIVNGINNIKSEHTKARAIAVKSIEKACSSADIIIGTSNEKGVITEKHLVNSKNSVMLIDAGKGCFTDEVVNNLNLSLYRVDVTIVQKYLFSALVSLSKYYGRKLGRKYVADLGVTLVSLGLLARRGEFIVDNIESPKAIIGLSAGKGVLRKSTPTVQKYLKDLKSKLNIN